MRRGASQDAQPSRIEVGKTAGVVTRARGWGEPSMMRGAQPLVDGFGEGDAERREGEEREGGLAGIKDGASSFSSAILALSSHSPGAVHICFVPSQFLDRQ